MRMCKHMKKTLAVACMAFMLAVGLTGCGNSSNKETETKAPVKEQQEQTSAKETKYPVTVECSDGTKVTIESEPKKVLSVAPNLTEMVYELGAGEKLVGRSDYCDYPKEVSEVTSVGTLDQPDMEQILELEPDIVIVSAHFQEENAKKLEELGIEVLTLYEEKELTGVYDMITTLGTALNCQEEAENCVKEMKSMIQEVEEKVANLEKPSVYYVVGYGEYGDYTAGGDTFIGGMLSKAGANNIAQDVSGWNITLEKIIEADPDIIVISEDLKDDFLSYPAYQELSAVKNGKVYAMDTDLLDRQGVRNAQGIRELAKLFYPDQF